MNNEQEIEIMRLIMAKNTSAFLPTTNEMLLKTAKKLSNAGIGDKKQAVKEAFEKLKEKYKDYKLVKFIGYAHRQEFDFNVCIDELFTELYGADEK